MNYTHYKNLLQKTASTKTVLIAIGALIAALLIFQAGIFVGYRKASFSYGAGDNFHHLFGEPDHREMMGFGGMPPIPGEEFTSAYGTTGTIVKISLPTIVVAGTDKVEKVVVLDENTILRHFRDDIKNADLKVGDMVVVIGDPSSSSSQIEARLIRVLPPFASPSNAVASSTK